MPEGTDNTPTGNGKTDGTAAGRAGHTPGPWSVPHFAVPDARCQCGYVLSEYQRGMGAIATVHVSSKGEDWRDGDHEPPEIAAANARLIAAAPDLLEVLKEMLRRHTASKQNWVQATMDAQQNGNRELSVSLRNTALQALDHFPIEQARAAIAKAEGTPA